MLFIGMLTEFMQLILQTCAWLKNNKFNILVMGINMHVLWKQTFVQASRFIDIVPDNNSRSD